MPTRRTVAHPGLGVHATFLEVRSLVSSALIPVGTSFCPSLFQPRSGIKEHYASSCEQFNGGSLCSGEFRRETHYYPLRPLFIRKVEDQIYSFT